MQSDSVSVVILSSLYLMMVLMISPVVAQPNVKTFAKATIVDITKQSHLQDAAKKDAQLQTLKNDKEKSEALAYLQADPRGDDPKHTPVAAVYDNGYNADFLKLLKIQTSAADLAKAAKLVPDAQKVLSDAAFIKLITDAKIVKYALLLTYPKSVPQITIVTATKEDKATLDKQVPALQTQAQKLSKTCTVEVVLGTGASEKSEDMVVSSRVRTMGRHQHLASAQLEHVVGERILIETVPAGGHHISSVGACFRKTHWSFTFYRRDLVLTSFHQHAAVNDKTFGVTGPAALAETGWVKWTSRPRGADPNPQPADAALVQLNWWHTCRCAGVGSMTVQAATLDLFGTLLGAMPAGQTFAIRYVGQHTTGTGIFDPVRPTHLDFGENVANVWFRITALNPAIQAGDSGGAVYVTGITGQPAWHQPLLLGIIKGQGVDMGTSNQVVRATPIWNIPIPRHYSVC